MDPDNLIDTERFILALKRYKNVKHLGCDTQVTRGSHKQPLFTSAKAIRMNPYANN